jgi:hypothetical protein
MKQISITCIICGTFIFSSPLLFQLGCGVLIAYTLANTRLPSASLGFSGIGDVNGIACLVFGACLIIVGVVLGFRSRGVSDPQSAEKGTLPPFTRPRSV